MNLKCYIVKDLLPNYADKVTSEETCNDIEKHFSECEQCKKEYQAMTQQIPKTTLADQKVNKKEVNYLKKCFRIIKIVVISIIILNIAIVGIFGALLLYGVNHPAKDITTDIADYNKYLGATGIHADKNLIYNDIFPDSIPSSADVEEFSYYYLDPFDPSYLCYLVYTCSDEDFSKELERLSEIESSEDYLFYGTTGFNYPVCAIYANDYTGYIYAMADKEENRLIYVELTYCNYFSEIDYEAIINKKHLPVGFDAKPGNPTRKKYDEETGLK